MIRVDAVRRTVPRALVLVAAALTLTACSVIRAVPDRGLRGTGEAGGSCAPAIAQAHVALAGAGTSPEETAAAHAASAAAMAEYHACLAETAAR